MRKYYTFNEQIAFQRIASRYDIDVDELLVLIVKYVRTRHEEWFTYALTELVGELEPFVKNELRPTLQQLKYLCDAIDSKIDLDIYGKIRIYTQ